MALFSKFFGRTISEAAAFALGGAMRAPLHPPLVELTQETWEKFVGAGVSLVPVVEIVAEGVAQGKVSASDAEPWATKQGYGGDAFNALVQIAKTGPGMAQAFNLWRRQQVDEAGFREALQLLGLQDKWISALWGVREEVFDPVQLAAAIHRNLIPDPGLLAMQLDTTGGVVKDYPTYTIDALAEAQGKGFDRDHLGVLVGLQGLPMSPLEVAHAVFRNLAQKQDFYKSVAQSNNRNEWADLIFEFARQIPTARDFLENALRGHHDLSWAYEQVARHGMSQDDALVLWQNQGRPLNLHQITQALAWGAKYNPSAGDNPDPWMQSVLLGPVRPEYYEMNDALKYNLPSGFYFRALQQQGKITPDEAEVWYKRLGWPPELAQLVAEAYGTPTGSGPDPQVKSAQTKFLTALHKVYVKGGLDAAQTVTWLEAANVTGTTQTGVMHYWTLERELEAVGVGGANAPAA